MENTIKIFAKDCFGKNMKTVLLLMESYFCVEHRSFATRSLQLCLIKYSDDETMFFNDETRNVDHHQTSLYTMYRTVLIYYH